MGYIKSRNVSLIGAGITLILIILGIVIFWNPLFKTFRIYDIVMVLLFIAFISFFLFYTVVIALSAIFEVIPLSYGTYTNEKFGFSILLPQEWEDTTKESSHNPEVILHARDKDRVAAVNIIAGPHPYGPHPSVEDLKIQALRHVNNLHGNLESIQQKKIGNIDAVIAVYEALSMKTKKVALVKDNTEFIITFSSVPDLFPAYEEVFDECLQSLQWKHT